MLVNTVNSYWLFWDQVTLTANKEEESFIYIPLYSQYTPSSANQYRIFISSGRRMRLILPKNWAVKPGDEIPFVDLVNHFGRKSRAIFNCETTGKVLSIPTRASTHDMMWSYGPADPNAVPSTKFEDGKWTTVTVKKKD